MENFYKPVGRQQKLKTALTGKIKAMSDDDLRRSAGVLREEADRIISDMKAANDDDQGLYDELERRYGGGFAQWIADRLGPSAAENQPVRY